MAGMKSTIANPIKITRTAVDTFAKLAVNIKIRYGMIPIYPITHSSQEEPLLTINFKFTKYDKSVKP
jgi:hypothetical protein